MRFVLIFIASVLVICFVILALLNQAAGFKFVPFLGNVSYFCSEQGVKYMVFHESKTAVVMYDTNGHVIICTNE